MHDIGDAENNTPEFFEDPDTDAENDILVPDFGDMFYAEELGTVSMSLNTISNIFLQPNFVSLSTMAFTQDITNLRFLANVALCAYSQEQQPAPVVPPQAVFGRNTPRPGEQPLVSAPSRGGCGQRSRIHADQSSPTPSHATLPAPRSTKPPIPPTTPRPYASSAGTEQKAAGEEIAKRQTLPHHRL